MKKRKFSQSQVQKGRQTEDNSDVSPGEFTRENDETIQFQLPSQVKPSVTLVEMPTNDGVSHSRPKSESLEEFHQRKNH